MSFPECYLFLILDTAVSLHSYRISIPQDVTRTVSSMSVPCYQRGFQNFVSVVPVPI